MRKLEYRPVAGDELALEMKALPDWNSSGDAISRTFSFDAYQLGLVFASAVGYLADHLDHHPDMTIGYKTVLVKSSTHSTGGLSPYDFELAERIDRLAAK